ncbi:MAG: CRR6 family NdhI maturation factor [Synechococcales cyanobacterium]
MNWVLALDGDQIHQLDMRPARALVERILAEPPAAQQQVRLQIDFPRPAEDPRELPEIPEVRLWFVRCDSLFPWLPFFLDWKEGELARYTAMLVPHQFNLKEGIQYHPEALEIFLMSKIFVLTPWLREHQVGGGADLRHMAQLLGYDIDPALFTLLES